MSNLTRRMPMSVSPLSDLFNAIFEDGPQTTFARSEPDLPLDISETDEEYIIRASMPGYKRDGITLEIDEGVLTVGARHSEEHEEKGERFHRRERRFGSVTRRLRLPDDLAEGDPDAEFADGVPTLRLPKAEKRLPKRIEVR